MNIDKHSTAVYHITFIVLVAVLMDERGAMKLP